MNYHSTIKGIYVPHLTPFRSDGSLDEEALRRIVDWLINKGVSGLYPNGSMGEFARLSFEERKRVVSIVVDEARGRVPVLGGAAEANLNAVLEMCHHCAEIGCKAVSITGPYYYKVSADSMEEYFRELATRSPIDIVLYNIPAFAGEIGVPMLKRLAMECPRIVGTKDSSADMPRFLEVIHEIKSQRPEFSVTVGWDPMLMPTVIMGGDGGTLSTAGVVPEVVMKIYRASRDGQYNFARGLQFKLMELFKLMVSVTNFPSGFRVGYELRGLSVGANRFPNSQRENAELDALRPKLAKLMNELGVYDVKEV